MESSYYGIRSGDWLLLSVSIIDGRPDGVDIFVDHVDLGPM